MKWLIVVDKYIPEIVGGNVIYVERFIKELIDLGHDVTLLAATNKKDCAEYEKIDKLKIYRVYNKKGTVGPLRFGNRTLLTQKISLLLAEGEYDVVNTHTACLLTLSFLKKEKKKYNFKLVSTLHAVHTYELLFDMKKYLTLQSMNYKEIITFIPKLILMYIFEYNTLKSAEGVVVMSEYVKNTIKMFFGTKFLNKVLVTGIGVSQLTDLEQVSKRDARAKLQLRDEETLFITVRRLAPRMGLYNLIKAFSCIKNDSARLLIVGKGELYEGLNKYIKKLNLQNKVTLLGFVDNDSLHYYYCASDCFILPTEQLEGFGIVTIEALNYNLPVIGTPSGATPEILSKFDYNLITESPKSKDIKEKINYYLANKSNYCDINYRDLVQAEYNWHLIINKIVEFIEQRGD